jgi:hypothetical protein
VRQRRGAISRFQSAGQKWFKLADPTFGDAPFDDVQSAKNSLKKII